MTLFTGLLLLALGIVVWLFGNRLWLLGAGAGALLGIGLARLLGMDVTLSFITVAGLAILLGVLGFMGKAFANIIALVVGFVAGGGITIGVLDVLGVSLGFLTWILALIGGLIGAGLFARFLDWGLILFAALVGSLLIVRGAIEGLTNLNLTGALGTVLVVGLTAVGIFYHARQRAPKKSEASG